MIHDCSHKNKLIRDGTSQLARAAKSLDPSYALPDERSLLELLTFLKKFATELCYYDSNNIPDGTFEIFLQQNSVCHLAELAGEDISKILTAFNDAAKKIADNNNVKKQLKDQFDLLFTLLFKVEKWLRNTDKNLRFYNEIFTEISSGLSPELFNLIAFYKKAAADGLVNINSTADIDFPYSVVSSKDILINNYFSPAWFIFKNPVTKLAFDNWPEYYNSIPPSEIYKPVGSLKNKGLYSQFFLQKSLDKILASFLRLLRHQEFFLEDMLKNYSSHEPHLGLVLSFLQLFAHARDQINTLTRRHFDFYLEEVLGLEKMEAVADKAFIIFELAKGIDKYKIEKDTSLSAGKDNTGKEVLFHVEKEIVINKASIAEIKNIFIDKKSDARIYAAPIANSADGNGSEFSESPGKWKPFGKQQHLLSEEERSMPDASTGFLVTSESLLLTEGNRKVKLDIHCNLNLEKLPPGLEKCLFYVYFSGESGWIKYKPAIILNQEANQLKYRNHIIFNKNLIQVLIEIEDFKEAVVALDPEIHDFRFDQKAPAMFVESSHESESFAYGFLKKLKINKLEISVSSDKTENLFLQSDQSALDPSKPFYPFGTIPKPGSSFIIGSKEVFNKKLTKLSLHGIWSEFPRDTGLSSHYNKYSTSIAFNSFKVDVKSLYNGQWTKETSADKLYITKLNLFKGDKSEELSLILYNDNNNPLKAADIEKLPDKYDLNAKSGFIKLELDNDNSFAFGHQIFPAVYAKETLEQTIANINKAEQNPNIELPKKPYTPSIKDFYLSYSASASLNFSAGLNEAKAELNFYQVLPFGYNELSSETEEEALFLLPGFGHMEESVFKEHNGELIIGFENISTPVSLDLLFKVAEGSEDPELPAQTVNWFYLRNNKWIKFEDSEIINDGTKNLTSTGIISLSLPSLSLSKITMLKNELLWIMAAVNTDTDAACEIINIHPQAVLAEFKNNNNDPERTGTPLLQGSISKLKVKDPNIKSINQPYSSFNGKVKEVSADFYKRVSERLRHKQRGITIWDYERLILQRFPELYKVKCINHTSYGYYDTLGDKMDSEFAPGYVSIIVIPKTYNLNAINPYEPKVTKAKILQIEEFIKGKISPFAAQKLRILNPLYEQIQLEAEVKFHKQYSDRGFYERQLNEDLKQFLSPWAYEKGKDIMLGGRIHKSVLIDFIEELPYVDYLKHVKMHHYIDNVLYSADITSADPSCARSAFVTINNADIKKEHIIKSFI